MGAPSVRFFGTLADLPKREGRVRIKLMSPEAYQALRDKEKEQARKRARKAKP
jgi:hypothetical protein